MRTATNHLGYGTAQTPDILCIQFVSPKNLQVRQNIISLT
jgi:hypothetical protein